MPEITCPLHKAAGDEIALISSNREITYKEFNHLVNKATQWLADNNIKKNDRVAILLHNPIEFPILLLALFRIGAVAVPMNYRLPEQSNIELLKQFYISHLICPGVMIPAKYNSNLSIISLDRFFDVMELYQYDNSKSRLSLEQDATIIFTSGSSGEPKGVLHSFGNHYYNASGSNENILLQQGDRWLVSLPFYHVGGLGIIFRTILAGATIVIPEPDENLEDSIIRYKVSHCSLVATQLYRLLKSNSIKEILMSLKALLIGGGRVPFNLIEKSVEAGIPIHTTYGLTEMASQVTTTPPNADIELLKTSGKLLKYRELKISDEGEIFVKSETLFRGYIINKGIDDSIDGDGWFHTGDMGKIDKKGYLTVTGRKDNMFISGGENICPETIEAALLQFDSIEEAVVVGVDDPEFVNRPVAFIKLKRKMETKKIEKSLRDCLPGYMIPAAFYELPNDDKQGGIKFNRLKLKQLAEKKYKSMN